MSILGNIAKFLFEDDGDPPKPPRGGIPNSGRNKEILVKRNGRYERITFNKYGEIISRRNE